MTVLARWDPFGSLSMIDREMWRLMSRMFSDPVTARGTRTAWSPAIDVYREGGDVVVQAELPGIDPEKQLELTVEGNLLRIEGQRSEERESQRDDVILHERLSGSFERVVTLPEGTDVDALQASYVDGVLTVRVPHPAGEAAGPRQIPVETRREAKQLKKSEKAA